VFQSILYTLAVSAGASLLFSATASAQDSELLLTPPYLQNVRADGITVMWETKEGHAGAVEFGTSRAFSESAEAATHDSGGGTTVYTAVLNGLAADTSYQYRVLLDGEAVTAPRDFRTAPDGDAPFSFAVWGDSQSTNHGAYDDDPYEPTRAMMKHIGQSGVNFAVGVGDHASDGDTYDQTRYHLSSSYFQRLGDNRRLRLSLNGHQISLDHDSLRWQAGVEGSIEQFMGDSDRVSASLEMSTQRYPDRHERDVNRAGVSIGTTRKRGGWQYQLSLLGAVEPARDDNNEQFGRWLAGPSARASWSPAARHELITSAIYRFSRYAEDQPLFGERRNEHDILLNGLWRWTLARGLDLESQITYQRSESSIEFFEHDRLRGRIGIRYQFFGGQVP